MDWLSEPGTWASFLTLSALEIVLGIDNVIFISLVASRLPKAQQFVARAVGLAGALVLRVAFLASVNWLAHATVPLFVFQGVEVSTRDAILFAGGAFLLYKATVEIHAMVEGLNEGERKVGKVTLLGAITQIMILDIVFSIDSVLTAIGMTHGQPHALPIMIAAIFVAIVLMLVAAGVLGRFIEEHPTTKMLALAFLLLVGVALIADAFDFHIPRGYLYAAIAFSASVEALNIWVTRGPKRKAEE